jgi:hypothetical protein
MPGARPGGYQPVVVTKPGGLLLAIALSAGAVAVPSSFAGDGSGSSSSAEYGSKGSSTTLVTPRGRPMPARWQRWVRRSLVPVVSGRIRVHVDGCPRRPHAVGCVYYTRPRRLYLDAERAALPATLYHELGHLYDMHVLRHEHRRRFKGFVGRRGRGWFRGRYPASEQFAEAYSFCARYRRIHSLRGHTTYGYDPSPKEFEKTCRMIRDASRTPGPPQPPPNPPAEPTNDPEPPPQPPDDPDTVPGLPLPAPPLPQPLVAMR